MKRNNVFAPLLLGGMGSGGSGSQVLKTNEHDPSYTDPTQSNNRSVNGISPFIDSVPEEPVLNIPEPNAVQETPDTPAESEVVENVD